MRKYILKVAGFFKGNRRFHYRAFRRARLWSNRELRQYADICTGAVVNVSAWEDKDKEGGLYRDYFRNKKSYNTTNFGSEQGTLQGTDGETYLDLEKELSPTLHRRFDCVFNHTTLEHVWQFRIAFKNLCALSDDLVILVVPWLQPHHTNYGDFWRFSPQAVARLFHEEGFTPLLISWNDEPRTAVYVFGIGTRNLERWQSRFGTTIVNPTSSGFYNLPKVPAGTNCFL